MADVIKNILPPQHPTRKILLSVIQIITVQLSLSTKGIFIITVIYYLKNTKNNPSGAGEGRQLWLAMRPTANQANGHIWMFSTSSGHILSRARAASKLFPSPSPTSKSILI
jgi:hypothetical protein